MAHEIVIPRLGWSMDEGTFVGWIKKDGDTVQAGEALFELESEKGVQEIEAVDSGVLRIPPHAPAPGTVVPVGKVIGFLAAPGESLPAAVSEAAEPKAGPLAPPAGPAARRMARKLNVSLGEVQGSGSRGRVHVEDIRRAVESRALATNGPSLPRPNPRLAGGNANEQCQTIASPRARRIARELQIDWTGLTGSGRGGRVRECDVRAAAEQTSRAASLEGSPGGRRQPIAGRRRVIAERMAASRQQTAPVTLTTRANASNLVNLREQFKTVGGAQPIPSFQDLIVKLVAGVLQRHPLLAARYEQDSLVFPAADGIDIRIAVDAEAGLLAPVIRNVPSLSMSELTETSRRLIERAKSGRLGSAELEGGVFTISNLGSFGIDAFTPIINLPEVAILGLGAIRREAVVDDAGQFVALHQITLSLTFDHRVVDGAPAARFLQDVATAISNPSAWLLGG